ncbi:NAD-dependent epimerase/dehydratase family protein [Bacillus sp. HMF5848]|uniref:NAD-dependent epimerase/dehydratase family protein n=1 Tax=Bacillus sp. HMF5848 TaxID=2495421 RepID=UPI000F7B0113|nr:NAD-dependent epimerase/dehydratase family protein [Bacillus sp. HMF5848]RSK26459.1 NAD-dependent epimerase/dehydratase family protein [Bacillus sp. HMF5848]
MNSALVVGCFNFVGFHLVEHMLERGIEVTGVFDKVHSPNDWSDKELAIGRNANFETIDLGSLNVTDLAKFDVVYYTLIDPNQHVDKTALSLYQTITTELLASLLSFCRKSNTPVFLISSYDVFNENDEVVSTKSIPNPSTLIGRLHLLEERLLLDLKKALGGIATIVRVPTAFGPWQPQTMVYQQIIDGEEIVIKENRRDMMYVRDLAETLYMLYYQETNEAIIHVISGKKNQWDKGFSLLSRSKPTPYIGKVLYEDAYTGVTVTTMEQGISEQLKHSYAKKL